MSNPVWKCAKCELGPCYIQCKRTYPRDIFGQDDGLQPTQCPYSSEEYPEFEFCAPEVRYSVRWMEELGEWLNGPGYDDAPEEIRDGLAVELHGKIDAWEAVKIIGILRNYEEDPPVGIMEQEEFEKSLKKISKGELLNAIFPEAFKAGLIYGELVRQRKLKHHELK